MPTLPKSKSRIKPNDTRSQRSIESEVESIIASLRAAGSKRIRDEMMPRYGITAEKAFGVGMSAMQQVVKAAKSKDKVANHELSLALWKTGWYEARMLATMLDDPMQVTSAQMDAWCRDFDNWAICDTACFKLFDQVDELLAFRKVRQWSRQKPEFIRRAGFAMLASMALHRKELDDELFVDCLPLVEVAASDDRNFVKKGASWALRGMAKRSTSLRSAVTSLARSLADRPVSAARWIGKDVLRQIK